MEKAKGTMSAAEAAKLVKRMVARKDKDGNILRDKDNNALTEPQAIKEDEIMTGSDGSPAIAEYPDRIVAVTTSGEKLTYEKPVGKK